MKKTLTEKLAWTMVAFSAGVAALDLIAASRCPGNDTPALVIAALLVGVALAQVIPAGLFVSLALVARDRPRGLWWLALGTTLLACPVWLLGLWVGIPA